MFDSAINYLDKFGPELLVIQFGFLVILSTLFLWLWFSNRRNYHNLKHAIPATIVKTYLDSIIQNSTALKSSLFRGGGLEVNGVPSVISLANLSGGESVGISGAPSTALLEELNQKKALIASLEAQLSSSQVAQREIESKFNLSKSNLAAAEKKIKELEDLLAQIKSSAGGAAGPADGALKAELDMVTKERDEIRDRLKEFEIISDDLANLKRLQQENEQLKRSLALQGGGIQGGSLPSSDNFTGQSAAPSAPNGNSTAQSDVSELLEDMGEAASGGSSADAEALEDFLSNPDAPDKVASEDSSNDEVNPTEAEYGESSAEGSPPDEVSASDTNEKETKSSTEKTPEDLLSEFEKMLG